MSMVDAAQITGVVLAGGRGMRMGGVDKGLQMYRGVPLALHVLRRLQPQVGRVLISANRHVARYAAFGVPVVADEVPDFAGPLAGFLSAMHHCPTPFLLAVPCDSPLFPEDLAARLSGPMAQPDCEIAVARAPCTDAAGRTSSQAHPVFCLMRTRVLPGLAEFIAQGGRKVGAWMALQRSSQVHFEDSRAFLNVNTMAELDALSD